MLPAVKPAVVLGLLFNMLDAVSYEFIIFSCRTAVGGIQELGRIDVLFSRALVYAFF